MSVSEITTNKELSNYSGRSLSPRKKSKSRRMESPENDTPSVYGSQRSLSPHKKSKWMSNASKFEAVLSDEDSLEPDVTAKSHNTRPLRDQVTEVEERLVRVEQRLNLHEDALDQMADVAVKLQEASHKNESHIQQIMLKIGRLTQPSRNDTHRLSKLDEEALGWGGSNNTKPTDANGGQGKRSPCSFCGKELAVTYLKKGVHQKMHCKKAAAAAAAKDEGRESNLVISDVQTLDGTSICSGEEFVVIELPE